MTGLRVAGLDVSRDRRQILFGVDAEVGDGDWLAVIGPNGAGKSTLLKAVAGLLPYAGEVTVGGVRLRDLPRRTLARSIAYTPQNPVVPPQMSVREYVLLGRTPHLGYLAVPGRTDRDIADGVIDRLDLAAFADREVGRLSGGERQRVVLARALAQQAPVLLLDEPTTALDLGHQQQVLELVDRLRRDDGLTVITTLHDLGVAAQYAERVLLLVDGRAVATGSAAEVLTPAGIAEHYHAHVEVARGPDGRPQVHLVRPGDLRADPAPPAVDAEPPAQNTPARNTPAVPSPSSPPEHSGPHRPPVPDAELVRHDGWPALVWRAGPGWRMISSAILGGGVGEREWVLNAQVRPGYSRMDPVAHLAEIAASAELPVSAAAPDDTPAAMNGGSSAPAAEPHLGVGLMTAADVEAYTTARDDGVCAWVTTGIGIPSWAAAPDEGRSGPPAPGTINILVAVPVPFSDAALVNAVATATEAKVQALLETGYACTGTPSDAVCVAARAPRPGEQPELFGGPRSVWGARIARAVRAAVAEGAREDRVRRATREAAR